MVVTKLTDKFHPGCFCVQPPGKLIGVSHEITPKGPPLPVNGEESFSEL